MLAKWYLRNNKKGSNPVFSKLIPLNNILNIFERFSQKIIFTFIDFLKNTDPKARFLYDFQDFKVFPYFVYATYSPCNKFLSTLFRLM